uniref:Uncharacterized protein n=1 Tax=Onchocerca volvulus TaxID=6282 RepID=A0A8R1Y671_ONCVO
MQYARSYDTFMKYEESSHLEIVSINFIIIMILLSMNTFSIKGFIYREKLDQLNKNRFK